MKTLFAIAALALGAVPVQEAPQPSNPLAQHEWLQQLVGEWEVTSEADMGSGGDPVAWKSSESVRSIGELWIVAEGTAKHEGQEFTSLMTLGYDPVKESFVGSWVDTMQTTLWIYSRSLDGDERVLTLEAEGPGFTDPSKTSNYRDQIELIGPDEKRMTSSVLGEDGAWTTFMTMEARRVK